MTGLALPDTISFWALPGYIATLRSIGLPTRGHVVHYQNLLATPLMFAAMLLIGRCSRCASDGVAAPWSSWRWALRRASFSSCSPTSCWRWGCPVGPPAELAAWTPAVVGILLGLALLFHTEDG